VLVVDTSAVLDAILDPEPESGLLRRLAEEDLHAPHLLDVEALGALRRRVLRGELAVRRAQGAREDLAALPITRYPHTHLLDRAWELRDNVTAYDAMFVALAEILGVPLVTVDARLAATTGHRATIELL
jgi:predicted nucleic acid-binding protein